MESSAGTPPVPSAARRVIAALAPIRRMPLWLRMAGGVALPVAALVGRDVIGAIGYQSPLAQFVPAVVIAAFLFGRGAGAVAAVTSTLLGRTMFPPFGSLAIESPRSEVLLLLFLLIFLLVATAIDMLFAALDQVENDAAALRQQAWLIDQSHDAILAWDPAGGIVHWSRGAALLYGYSAAQAMGRNVHELLATRHPEPIAAIMARLATEGEWTGDVMQRTAGGDRVAVASRLRQVTGANRRPLVLETDRDVTAKRAAERRAADVELRLAAIVDALPIGVLVSEAPSGRIMLANRAVETILRHPVEPTPDPATFDRWEAWHADGRPLQPEEHPMAQVLATGAAAALELQYRRGDGRLIWLRAVGAPIRDVVGALVGAVVGLVDVDKERRLLEHQRLLMAELSHRVKNMLAVVQGIASSTLRRSDSLQAFGLAFEGRLQALSAAHTQLLRTDWRGAQLRGLLEAVLAPHAAGDRLQLAGPDVALGARQGVALALVLHELATNAARHGALSTPAGRIRIHWDVLPGDSGVPRLQLCWAEAGLVTPPAIGGDGLGMRLITRSVEGDLGGRIDLQPGAEGLSWIMTFDLEPIPDAARGE